MSHPAPATISASIVVRIKSASRVVSSAGHSNR
jgi:hypothetical protein